MPVTMQNVLNNWLIFCRRVSAAVELVGKAPLPASLKVRASGVCERQSHTGLLAHAPRVGRIPGPRRVQTTWSQATSVERLADDN